MSQPDISSSSSSNLSPTPSITEFHITKDDLMQYINFIVSKINLSEVSNHSLNNILEPQVNDVILRLDETAEAIEQVRQNEELIQTEILEDLEQTCKDLDQIFSKIDNIQTFIKSVHTKVNDLEKKTNEIEKKNTEDKMKKVLPKFLFSVASKVSNNLSSNPTNLEQRFNPSDYFIDPSILRSNVQKSSSLSHTSSTFTAIPSSIDTTVPATQSALSSVSNSVASMTPFSNTTSQIVPGSPVKAKPVREVEDNQEEGEMMEGEGSEEGEVLEGEASEGEASEDEEED